MKQLVFWSDESLNMWSMPGLAEVTNKPTAYKLISERYALVVPFELYFRLRVDDKGNYTKVYDIV
jgi:hypothetical protein